MPSEIYIPSEIESQTFSDTKLFWYWIRYFSRYQILTIPKPILFFDTKSETTKKMEKFWNREVSKPKRHTLDSRHGSKPKLWLKRHQFQEHRRSAFGEFADTSGFLRSKTKNLKENQLRRVVGKDKALSLSENAWGRDDMLEIIQVQPRLATGDVLPRNILTGNVLTRINLTGNILLEVF